MLLIDYSQILIANVVVLNTGLGASLSGREVRGAVGASVKALVNALGQTYGTPVLCCDRHSWRRDEFPQYKASRRTAGDPQSIKAVIDRLGLTGMEYEFREAFGWPVVAVNGAEGDDVIATLALAYNETKSDGSFFTQLNDESMLCERSVIVSKDKDFDQLGDIIEIFDQGKHTFSNPNHHLALKTLIMRGDASDGVPSINCPDDYFVNPLSKRKPVTAKQFASLPEVLTEEVIMSVCPEKIDNYRRNDKLVNLRKVPVNIRKDVLTEFAVQADYVKTHKPDPMAFCVRWGLLNLISN